jgi:hypothetical protein
LKFCSVQQPLSTEGGAIIAQTQQILMLYLSTCMRMSKSMPSGFSRRRLSPVSLLDRRQNSKVVLYTRCQWA